MNFEEADVFGVYTTDDDATSNNNYGTARITLSQYKILLMLMSHRLHFSSLVSADEDSGESKNIERGENENEEETERATVEHLFQLSRSCTAAKSERAVEQGCPHMAALQVQYAIQHYTEVLPRAVSTDIEALSHHQQEQRETVWAEEEEKEERELTRKRKKGKKTTTSAASAAVPTNRSQGGPYIHCFTCIKQQIEQRERQERILQQYTRHEEVEDEEKIKNQLPPPLELVNLKGHMHTHYIQNNKNRKKGEEADFATTMCSVEHSVALVSAGTALCPLFVVYCLHCRQFLPLTCFTPPSPSSPAPPLPWESDPAPAPAPPPPQAQAQAQAQPVRGKEEEEDDRSDWIAADTYEVMVAKLLMAFHLLFVLDEQKQKERERAKEAEDTKEDMVVEGEGDGMTYEDYKCTVIKNVFLFSPFLFAEEDAVEEFEKDAAVTWGAAVLPGAAVCSFMPPRLQQQQQEQEQEEQEEVARCDNTSAIMTHALSFPVTQRPLKSQEGEEEGEAGGEEGAFGDGASNKETDTTVPLLLALDTDTASVYAALSDAAEPPYHFGRRGNEKNESRCEDENASLLPESISGHVVVGFVMQFEDEDAEADEDEHNSDNNTSAKKKKRGRTITQEKIDLAVRKGHYREAVRLVYIEDTRSWELARVLYHCTWAEVQMHNGRHVHPITLHKNKTIDKEAKVVVIDPTDSIRQFASYDIDTAVPFFVFYYYFPILFYEGEKENAGSGKIKGTLPVQQQLHCTARKKKDDDNYNNDDDNESTADADFPFSVQSRTLALIHQVYMIARAIGELMEKGQI